MKKYLSLILLALLPLVANAQDVYVCIDGIYYYIYEDYAEVANHYSYSGAMTIPESIRYNDNTFSVTSIGDFAFWNCNGLTSITIPNSLTSIGKQAFSGCSGLTSINIPESVTSVGGAAFSDCIGLTSVTIECPNVGFWFRGLSSIKNITLGEKVISIGDYAFWNCSGLTDITIPESVTYIGNGAFHGCGLTSIIIPNNVTNIGEGAFGTCTNLTSVIIGSGVTSISDLVFWNCKSLISITIPESVTNIGWCSFMECSSLTDVYCLAKNVPETDSDAFVYTPIASTTLHVPAGSVDLYKAASPWNEFGTIVAIKGENSNIEFADANVKAICVSNWDTNGDGELSYAEAAAVTDLGTVFKENQSITTFNELRYFTGLTSIGNSAFVRCKSLTSIDIPVSVTSIGESAFFGCSGLTSITIPNNVTSIEQLTFADCTSLISITIPNSVTSIGDGALADCTSLTSITIPNSVTSIGISAFHDCRSLGSVTIPNSVTSIGSYAFNGCSGLTYIKVETGNTTYDSRNDCNAIIETATNKLIAGCQNTVIPNSVISIGERAFVDCWGLTSITIPNSVIDIDDWAFMYCSRLTSITIPSSVKSIGNEAFFGCGLTSITIPESVTSIGYGAFACCNLTSIKVEARNQIYDSRNNCNAIIETATNTLIACCNNTDVIPESVTNIGKCAFYGCDAITSIIIPEGVTSIGGSAFRYCYNLTSIIIPESVTSIGNSVFQYCYNLTSVNIPKSITRIEYYTFSWCHSLTSITIPNNVTSIGSRAFEECSNLTDFYCYAENVPETYSNAFDNTPIASATLHVPAGSIDLYKATSPWSEFGNFVALTTDLADIEINETNFPDANFRSWINQKFGADGVLTGAEIASATYINVSNRGIQNLKGIECFTELTELDCSYNLLTTLDVTKNTNLKTLNLSHNNLSGDITGISGYMITSGQSSPITSLNISDNKLSGNIGLFANRFINLKSLNASGNCLEDVYPMIPATVTALDISRQTISRVVPLHLAKLSISDIGTKVPSILLYDHVNRTFTPNINLMCNTADNSWGMMMSYQNGQLAVPYVSEQKTYYGESGDTLNVAVYNNDGTPEGSTFRISLSFDEGDSNFDGQVNVLDLQTDILYIMEKYLTRPYNFTAANMWDDNLINVQDIIRLVDLLMNMEQTESASNARRKAPSLETNPEASIYIQDGQLILNTIEPVAALDLLISNASSINVADNLERMGMSVVTKKSSDGLHIIAYSMSGNYIPSGISAIGTVDADAATVRSVMLSDSEANAISVSIDNDANGIHSIENGKLIIDNEDAVYDLSGRQIVNGRLKRGVYIKNGRKIAK